MPKLKPDTSAAYLHLASHPLNQSARAKHEAEVRANLNAFLRLLIFSAIAGALLALRK
jgi:hypothetical protein